MPGRRKRIPNIYNVDVPLPAAGHTVGAHHMLSAFIKHLVFAREQCHAPFTDLEAHVQACQQLQLEKQETGRRVRLKPASRKAIKYYARLSAMLSLLHHIPLAQLRGMPVAVLLGSSVLRPREAYCFTYPADMEQLGVSPPSDKQISDASRRLLRTLVMEHQTITEWDTAPGPTKMFLLFQAREGSLATTPEGFVAKRAFSINLRKAFQVNINLGMAPYLQALPPAATAGCGGVEDGELQQLSQRMSTKMRLAETGEVAPPGIWYQCVVHAKGIKPPQTTG